MGDASYPYNLYQKKPIQSHQYPFRRRPPRKRRDRNSPQIIPVDASCWIPRLLMVLSAIQAPWRLTWSYQHKSSPSFFVIDGLDWCITTINSNLTWGRTPKALHSFLWPTKPPISKMAMNSVKDLARETPLQPVFDTDAHKFLIDSGASTHLWSRCQDFSSYRCLSREEQEQDKVLGVNGKTIKPIGIGTVLLKIKDDLNHVHALEIQDVRHMPEIPLNIFVPQAFIQQRQSEGDSVASCSINATGIILKWMSESGWEVSKYVPLNRSNIGIAFTASGYKNFKAFAAMFAMPATYVSDDEEDETVPSPSLNEQPTCSTSPSPHEDPVGSPSEGVMRSPSKGVTTDFKADPHLIPQEPDAPLMASNQALLMAYHEQLGHTSFAQLQELVKQGIIPKKLANVPLPKCPSCLYGKAHKKPWRTHKVDPKIKPSTIPGAVVSIDQLESPIPGFVPIARGQPTTSRYRGASVFADHASGFICVHLHQAMTTQETIDAKHAFEHIAEQHAVRIRHYHCNNVCFADRAFMDNVRKAGQTITFCGVGAHHQNGVAERRIRDITESACTMLLHAAHQWPKAITSNLWPQALKHAVNVRNALPRKGKNSLPSHCSPTQQSSQTSNTSIPSDARLTSSKRLYKPVPRFPNGMNDLEWVSSCATHLTMPLRYH